MKALALLFSAQLAIAGSSLPYTILGKSVPMAYIEGSHAVVTQSCAAKNARCLARKALDSAVLPPSGLRADVGGRPAKVKVCREAGGSVIVALTPGHDEETLCFFSDYSATRTQDLLAAAIARSNPRH